MEISFEIQDHLRIADQRDNRVVFLSQRIKSILNKPDFAQKKYDEVLCLRQHVNPFRLHKARLAEFERLSKLSIRTNEDELKYWRLMECLLSVKSSYAEDQEKILKEFRRKEVLPDQEKIIRKNLLLEKLRLTGIEKHEFEELFSLIDLPTITTMTQYYEKRGDYSGGIEAIKRFGKLPIMAAHFGNLLQNLQKFHEKLALANPDFIVESVERVRNEFYSLKKDEGKWEWIVQLHLLVLALLEINPGVCIELCNEYLTKLSKANHSALLAVVVSAYERLDASDKAIATQKLFLEAMQYRPVEDKLNLTEGIFKLLSLESKILPFEEVI